MHSVWLFSLFAGPSPTNDKHIGPLLTQKPLQVDDFTCKHTHAHTGFYFCPLCCTELACATESSWRMSGEMNVKALGECIGTEAAANNSLSSWARVSRRSSILPPSFSFSCIISLLFTSVGLSSTLLSYQEYMVMTSLPPPRTKRTRSNPSVRTSRNSMSGWLVKILSNNDDEGLRHTNT